VVVSKPPFEEAIHTASPYHFHAKDAKELLDPGMYIMDSDFNKVDSD
jgi:hypothetical protein